MNRKAVIAKLEKRVERLLVDCEGYQEQEAERKMSLYCSGYELSEIAPSPYISPYGELNRVEKLIHKLKVSIGEAEEVKPIIYEYCEINKDEIPF